MSVIALLIALVALALAAGALAETRRLAREAADDRRARETRRVADLQIRDVQRVGDTVELTVLNLGRAKARDIDVTLVVREREFRYPEPFSLGPVAGGHEGHELTFRVPSEVLGSGLPFLWVRFAYDDPAGPGRVAVPHGAEA